MNNKHKLIFSILLYWSVLSPIHGQYISGVTQPDKSTPKITNSDDISYRLASSINRNDLTQHLSIIASDSLEGRETGEKGLKMAADYIVSFLRKNNIKGIPGTESHYQPVEFTYSKWIDTDIYIQGERFRMMRDFIALPDKNKNMPVIMDKEVVFLGYGIDDKKYSDYKKAKVADKIIMINHGEPLIKDSISVLTGTKQLSDWSDVDLTKKLMAAKKNGVKLVLIIESDIQKVIDKNRRSILGGTMNLGKVSTDSLETASYVYISTSMAKAIIGQQEEQILKARKKLSKGKRAMVKLNTDLIINLFKEDKSITGYNIVGIVYGKSKPEEYVVMSAHYDHLGKKGDEVFNGADDNGSGTVTLMEIAEAYNKATLEANRPERSVVFVWFCGEEKGLLGSYYYSENPIFPLDKTIVNINMDMVGRVDDNYMSNPEYIYVIGSDRLSTELHQINESVNQKYTQLVLDYKYNDETDPNRFYYRSDHYNFAKNGIPSIFYFNGTHADYHRTTDDVEKINFNKMATIGQLIFHTSWELANRPTRIVADKK